MHMPRGETPPSQINKSHKTHPRGLAPDVHYATARGKTPKLVIINYENRSKSNKEQ